MSHSAERWRGFHRDEVIELYDDYAVLLDRGDYTAWLDLFTADAEYRAVARENHVRGLPLSTIRCDSRDMLADRMATLDGTQFFAPRVVRHLITAIRPADQQPDEQTDGARLAVGAHFIVTESLHDAPTHVHSAGEYVDEVTREDGGLRFSRKVAVYDAPLVPTSLIIPL